VAKIGHGIAQLPSFQIGEPAVQVVEHADELPAKVSNSGELDVEGDGVSGLPGPIRGFGKRRINGELGIAAKALDGCVDLSMGEVATAPDQGCLLGAVVKPGNLEGVLSGKAAELVLETRIKPEDGHLGFATAL